MLILARHFIFLFFTLSVFSVSASELFELANKKFNEHQYDEAKIHIKNLINQQPSNIPARFLMVELLLAVDQASLAETELNIIEGLGGDHKQVTLQRSSALLMQNKYNEMLSLFNNNYIDKIFAAKMFVLKGLAHLGLRQLILSEEAFNQALLLNHSNFDAMLGLAQLKVNRFQYHDANILVDQVINIPFPPEKAWLLKATIEQRIGNINHALLSINRVLLNNAENIEALLLRATLLFELKDYNGAQNDALLILKNVPNEPRAKFIQAAIAVKDNDTASSKKLIEETAQTLSKISAADLRTSPSYLYLAGVIFYQQNQYLLAKDYFSQYIEIDNFNVNAKILMARILMEQGAYDDAKSQLVKANIQHGGNSQLLTLLAVCYLELQQYEAALAYFQQVKNIQPSGSVDIQLAKTYLSLNQTVTAIQLLNEGDFNDQQQVLAGFLLVKSYLKERKTDLAVKIAIKLSLLQPENPEFQHHLGFVYQTIGDLEKAQLHFKQALALNELHIKSMISLAEITSAMGQADKALTQLQSALVQLPNNIQLLKALANQFERMGQQAKASSSYQNALKQQPNSEALMISFVTSLARQRRYDEAIEAINGFLLSQQKTAKLYLLLGRLYLNTKQTQLAIESYRDALKYDANKSQVYFYIAKAYQGDRKFSAAVAAYEKSIAWAPDSLEPLLALASYLNEESRPNEAIEVLLAFDGDAKTTPRFIETLAHSYYLNKQYDKAEQSYLSIKQSGQVRTIAGLALVYQKLNQHTKATALVEVGLKDNANNVVLLGTLAEIYIKNEQWSKAEEIYKQLIILNKNQPIWLNNAAFVAMSQSKFEQAKDYATRSVSLDGNSPDSLDTLGWIYYQTKEYAQALPLLRNALAIDYSNVEIKYHMALTLKALGQDREAFNMLREVVNSQVAFSAKKQARQTLESWGKS
tara:strand:- start:3540 stop:6320 length:2781 start_codon:yes stop_codon:yes gene_type:complete